MIFLIFSNILLIFYISISLVFKKEAGAMDQYLEEKSFLSKLVMPFFIFLTKRPGLINYLVTARVKQAIRLTHEEDFARFFIGAFASRKLALIVSFLFFFSILAGLEGSPLIFILSLVLIAFSCLYMDKKKLAEYEKKEEEIKIQLPIFIMRLALVNKAGIGLRKSLAMALEGGQTGLYQDLADAKKQVENGASEKQALVNIREKTDDLSYRKLLTSLIKGLEKGGVDLYGKLVEIKEESEKKKRALVIDKTKMVNSKLLLPNILIFAAIMVMTMLPLILNLN